MRGRKSQEVVLRELFSFALGVIIMILIIVLFNSMLAPQVKEFSVNEQSYSMIYHFNSLFENAYESITKLNTDSLELSYELPREVGGQNYRVFVDASELCIRTRGDVTLLRCINLSTHATISGSYLSGTDLILNINKQNGEIIVGFTNEAITYEQYIYYPACGAAPVVSLNNSATYSAQDSLVCGCNTKILENQLYNPNFDEGINYWTVQTSDPSHVYSMNNTNYITNPSLFMQSNYPNPANQFALYQPIPAVNNLTIDYYGTNSSFSFASLSVTYNNTGIAKVIIYMLFGGAEWLNYCNTYQDNARLYINCLNGESEHFTWNSLSVNPIIDGSRYFALGPNDYYNLLIGPRIAGSIWFSVDDLSAETNSDNLYCDKDNDGYADGVCYQNECAQSYLGRLTGDRQFFYNDNKLLKHEFKNFNSGASCTLLIDTNSYPMSFSNNEAYYQLGLLNAGNHNYTINCISDNTFSINGNIYSSLLKHNWTTGDNFTQMPSNQHVPTIGDLMPEYPGKETIFADFNAQSTWVISSEGEQITNFSTMNTETPYMYLIADINNDLTNELIFNTRNNIYAYNNNLEEMWSVAHNSNTYGGIAIADINESAGLEIALNTKDFFVYNSAGELLWWRQGKELPGFSDYFKDKVAPVITDINPTNPGVELLFTGMAEIEMITTDNQTLYSFDYSNRNNLFTQTSVGELRSDYAGKEVVLTTNTTATTMSLYILDSTLSPICTYDYTYTDGLESGHSLALAPVGISIGDVTGDGNNEIVLSAINDSEGSEVINDYYFVIDNNCNELNNYLFPAKHLYSYPTLLEVYSTNPGLEIINPYTNDLLIIDYQGNELFRGSNLLATGDSGPYTLADDIDGDTYLELITFDYLNKRVMRYDTIASATNNYWITSNHDLTQTGYQD